MAPRRTPRAPRAPTRPRPQQTAAREQRQEMLINLRLRQQAARARIVANREQQRRAATVQWRY